MKLSLKKHLCDVARAEGFAACRVTTAEPLSSTKLLEWLDKSHHGTMNWLARNPEVRCDPAAILPGARSVICCAYPYGEKGISPLLYKEGVGEVDAGFDPSRPPLTKGRRHRARFARGADYHTGVREKLEAVAVELKQHVPGARTKCCVDTSPLFEKALAARAGIGWIGHHTLLINPSLGSWFVLGEIVTDVVIEPDAPIEGGCGDCRACLDACPTRALEGGMLDARRCISYLTTEHKGDVPSDLAAHIPEGTYGCDVCQEVCPFNCKNVRST